VGTPAIAEAMPRMTHFQHSIAVEKQVEDADKLPGPEQPSFARFDLCAHRVK
jgi:hypothetical protein